MIDHEGASAGDDECEEKDGQYSSIHMGACVNWLSGQFRLTVSLACCDAQEDKFSITRRTREGALEA
jgi:hypothetical protein